MNVTSNMYPKYRDDAIIALAKHQAHKTTANANIYGVNEVCEVSNVKLHSQILMPSSSSSLSCQGGGFKGVCKGGFKGALQVPYSPTDPVTHFVIAM